MAAVAPPTPAPAPDRAPDQLAAGTPQPLRSELEELLGADRVCARASDLIRYASDASPYRRFPQAVVLARTAADVAAVLDYGRRRGIGVTLRAGGTSLNGQAQGDGILVDVRRHWRGVRIEDGGARVRVRPGSSLGQVNRLLARHNRRLGPDPASTDFATVGGVIANNSGGMRCGVTHDSYRTVRSLTFVLASGTTIDTAAPDAAERFAEQEPELAGGLAAIRDRIRADGELAARIARKFEIKNTTGYRLCAFLDADEPLEIFRRLLVGSEGTLAFIAEAVFDTVAVPHRTALAWLHFADIDGACAPVPELVAAGARAVELMVAPALIAASHSIGGAPERWRELDPASAALLVEFGADDAAALESLQQRALEIAARHNPISEPEFVGDDETIELYWNVREGLQGLVGRLRPPGTALIIEDVCVPPAQLSEAARALQELLGKHGFLTGVAGHASAGNLHFMLTPEFSEQSERDRYEAFMGELVELITVRFDGSLKAEHGTGVNMAPFVEREWGRPATELMWQIKRLADPDAVLGPGVLLNSDPGVHLRNLKTTPPIEEVATTCIECGFCEPVCPSRDLTTTPRQRIVLRREMARQPAGSPVLRALLAEYEYDGLATCAADGTCKLACPVAIDTGKLVKELRAQQRGPRAERLGVLAAGRFALAERVARGGLRAARLAPALDRLRPLPPPAPARLPVTDRAGASAVYMPACINRIFGHSRGSLAQALVDVSARAGSALWIPPDVAGHCCATPWTSKGYRDGAAVIARRSIDALWRWSDQGRLPIVIDASSCAQGFGSELDGVLDERGRERRAALEVIDSVAWAHDRLLGRLTLRRRVGRAVIHPTCATRHLGLDRKLAALAAALADDAVVPVEANCCGFAGDRGFLRPELTAAATRDEAAEVAAETFDAHLSSNRTCELGLERATGAPYASFVYLLDELSR